MNLKSLRLPLAVGLLLAAALAVAKDVTPSADAILKEMSSTLAGARQWSFKGTREIGAQAARKHDMQSKSGIELIVARAEKVAGVSTDAAGTRKLFFDGQQFTLVDGIANTYATVPLKATLDELPAQLAATYGLLPPLADFIVSDPYTDIKRRTKSVSYLGTGKAGSPAVKSHHLKLAGTLADAELSIGVEDHLPRKMTAKVKAGADKGTTVAIEFTEWNLAAPVTDATFVYAPGNDVQKIPMITRADMEAATKGKQ